VAEGIDEGAAAEADADALGEVADAEGCGRPPPGIWARPMAPTEQAADVPDPVVAPSPLHRDEAVMSVTEPGVAAAVCDGRTTVTCSSAWVAAPPGVVAMYRPAPAAATGTAASAHQDRARQ
jgi:hypothetical protein